jgi:flagellar motor switch protein FliN
MTDSKENVLLPGGAKHAIKDDSSIINRASINSDVLNNIPVTISVEVGRTSLKIRDLMRLTQGSVVELDRLAGEPLDLLVNNTLVAQGEVVLVNDRYGVRLTQVIPAAERIKHI